MYYAVGQKALKKKQPALTLQAEALRFHDELAHPVSPSNLAKTKVTAIIFTASRTPLETILAASEEPVAKLLAVKEAFVITLAAKYPATTLWDYFQRAFISGRMDLLKTQSSLMIQNRSVTWDGDLLVDNEKKKKFQAHDLTAIVKAMWKALVDADMDAGDRNLYQDKIEEDTKKNLRQAFKKLCEDLGIHPKSIFTEGYMAFQKGKCSVPSTLQCFIFENDKLMLATNYRKEKALTSSA